MDHYLLVIVGPTAVGKTKLAIELARFYDAEIISADSRQFYKELEIGTAKPSPDELAAIPHHFVNSHSIFENVSAGQFEKIALAKIRDLFRKKQWVVMVGGSGLYIDAVTMGFAEIPAIDRKIRQQLNDRLLREGLEALANYLEKVDPVYSVTVDPKNPQRVVRALEVYEGTGIPYSEWRKPATTPREFEVIKIGLEQERSLLYQRIDRRMELMIEEGLFEEAERLFEYRHLNALQTVGYKEIFDHLQGQYDRAECVRLLKRNSRRYAKRQLTWFKRDAATRWFEPGDLQNIINYVKAVTS